MDFYHFLICLRNLESISLSIAQLVHTYPTSEPISREWDSHPIFPWDIPFKPLIWSFMEFFYVDRRLLLFMIHLSSHSLNFHFHISKIFLWRHNCVNGGCIPLNLIDSKEWVNDSWLYNMSLISSMSRNQKKYIWKFQHFQAFLWLVSMWWFSLSMEIIYLMCIANWVNLYFFSEILKWFKFSIFIFIYYEPLYSPFMSRSWALLCHFP